MHANDNAREGRPGVWIFQGRSVVLLVIGAGLFVGLFRILDFAGIDLPLNFALSLLPLALMTVYVWRFVNDKPASYAQDLLAWHLFRFRQWLYMNGALDRPPSFWIRSGELPAPGSIQGGKPGMSYVMPDGRVHEGHVVWGDLSKGSVLSKGYAVQFPDLSASDDQAFIDLESDIRLMLGSLKADERLQLQFYTSSDFSGPLNRFVEDTRANSKVEICSKVRDELAFRYRGRMDRETLIQANVRLYLSSQIPKLMSAAGRRVRGFDEVFKVLQRAFDQRQQFFDLLLRSYGGSVQPLDNMGHYLELLKCWSPGQAKVWNPKPDEMDWLRTVTDLCQFSELAPRREPEQGFYLDGYYFGVMVFKAMPRSTWPKTMEPFFALTIPNLRVVVNMQPLPVESEMRYEEERFAKLVSNIDARSPSLQSEVGLDKHRERMRRLMSNQVVPFRAQIIVIAHDRTPDGLDTKMEALSAAIGKTGAEPYRPSVRDLEPGLL